MPGGTLRAGHRDWSAMGRPDVVNASSVPPPLLGRGRGRSAAPSREVLLDAALEAFAEHGFNGTSVREVARELGVHHNHFPQRFGTKEQLWYAAIDHGFTQIGNDMLPVFALDHDDRLTRLRDLMIAFVEANARRPAVLRILNQEAICGGARLDYISEHYITPVYEVTVELLRDLHREGVVRTDSAGLLYFFITNGTAGGPLIYPHLAAHLGVQVDTSDPDAVHCHAVAAVDLFFDGLAVSP
jgi:AcrR family transcriptional regulator